MAVVLLKGRNEDVNLHTAVEKCFALNKSVEPWQWVELDTDQWRDHPTGRVVYERRWYSVYAVDPTTGHGTYQGSGARLPDVEWYYAIPGRVSLVGTLDPDAWV